MTSELKKDLQKLANLLAKKVKPKKITRYYSIDDSDTTLQSHRFGTTWIASLNARLYRTAALNDWTIKDHETVASHKSIHDTMEEENTFQTSGQATYFLAGGSINVLFHTDHNEMKPGQFIATPGIYNLTINSGSGKYFGKTGHIKLTISTAAPKFRKVEFYFN